MPPVDRPIDLEYARARNITTTIHRKMTTDKQFAALAALKLGQPADALATILGDAWRAPGKAEKGHFWLQVPILNLEPSRPFYARITTDGTIGALGFYRDFPQNIAINGVSIGMPLESVRKIYPALLDYSQESNPKHGIDAYLTASPEGDTLVVLIKDGGVLALRLERSGSEYPGESPAKTYLKRQGIRAYDLDMLHREVNRTAPDNHGWVFGLPPGITPEQWPLDPISGYPLMHGFTIKLPEDYRVHGPEIVALSFFATAADQNDGGARKRDGLFGAITTADAPPPDNRHLLPFWKHAKARHPRLHRMSDILDYEYAVILLTGAEFNGPLCQPPDLADNPYLKPNQKPQWMTRGGAYDMFDSNGGLGLGDRPVEELYTYKILGAIPEPRLDWNRAISCTPRAHDPNAGLAPKETYGEEPADTGYVSFYYYEGDEISTETHREHAWSKGHKPNHIGGTMRPVQATPELSPYYIGFEEYFGGYNFGAGGNAQLDFLEMKFDWACG